jgi:hypothetical protein
VKMLMQRDLWQWSMGPFDSLAQALNSVRTLSREVCASKGVDQSLATRGARRRCLPLEIFLRTP